MDVQEQIVARFDAADLLARLQRALVVARNNDMLVIYVKVGFRPGYPDVSPHNASFSRIADVGGLLAHESRVHPAIAPRDREPEVVKKRVSAFAGSDLEVILRSREVRQLVLTGIATSGVVLSTLRAAADMDHELVVLEDCCADADPEVHRVLVKKVFPRQARVMDVASWESALAAG